MANNTETLETTLAPEDAFAILGNEIRMEILQTLGEADEPLPFSELRDRIGMRDSGQFNYHLGKLDGHFIRNNGGGYVLRQNGRRVIEAVLSGAVIDSPVLEPTLIDVSCPLCDADTVVAFNRGYVRHYCTECAGHYGPAQATTEHAATGNEADEGATYGFLGALSLPPAGLRDRTPEEVFRAAYSWGVLELLEVANGICPRCSAPLTESLNLCRVHDTTEGLCEQCDNRYGITIARRCPNCPYSQRGAFVLALLAHTDVFAFLISHGIDPVSPSDPTCHDSVLMDYDEELLSEEPFEARFTFTIDDDSLTLTVDDSLNVVEVHEG